MYKTIYSDYFDKPISKYFKQSGRGEAFNTTVV